MASQPVEVVFYIHGVSGDRRGRSHVTEYATLHNGIRHFAPDFPKFYSGAEWGWNPTGKPGKSHLCLTDAQSNLGARLETAIRSHRDWTLNPARIGIMPARELFMYGFGDMFYYVSRAGKDAVRAAVAMQICSFLKPYLQHDDEAPISLTLIGHSAGSVIAYDFAFFLFQTIYQRHRFLPQDDELVDRATLASCRQLRSMADEGRLRIRRLFTFGSPIAPLAMRSDSVLEVLAEGGRLNPVDYGLTHNSPCFDPLDRPRWVNFWDVDDVIGWPVEPLMGPCPDTHAPVVEDVYIDVSDLLSSAHNRFWSSKEMHQEIAERW